jgi:hypothetical protein
MKKLLLIFVLAVFASILMGCEGNSQPQQPENGLIGQYSIGIVTSMYCYRGDMELKTDRGFVAVALTRENKCPIVQLNTEAFVSKYTDGSCWIYWSGRSFKCGGAN